MKIKKPANKSKEPKKEEHRIEEAAKKEMSKEKLKTGIRTLEEKSRMKKRLLISLIAAVLISTLILLFDKNWIIFIISFFVIIAFFFLYFYFKAKLQESSRVKKIEEVFPDFLQLMSSNLRAGITIDRAMLLSSKEEFYPLNEEILKAGKDITTGKSIEFALLEMSKRIKSERIEKTILLILAGIRAGGNLAILLEETASNMREKGFVEKRAASNVLMYVIFVFIAVSIGAPVLFSLSNILVETLTKLLSGIPAVETSMNLPFTMSSVNISIAFIRYFSIIFIIVTDILASLVLGLINKGEEKEGLKYLIPLLIISISIFFIVRIALSGFVSGLFG